MASYTWTGNAGDGNYGTATNWTPNGVPGPGDTVTISTAAATAINLGNGLGADVLTTNKFVTLNIGDNASFTLGSGATGTLTNVGTLALNTTNDTTSLIIGATTTMLTGGGTVVMDNNQANRIIGAAAGDKLVNVNNLIEGSGQIGAGTLTLTNSAAGTILANQSNALILNTGSATITNAGLLESSGNSGGLIIQSVVANGTSGHVTAAGGNVYLQGADLMGGTLSSSGGAAIVVQSRNSATLDGTANAVTNTGLVAINDQGTLGVLGSILNTGTIAVASTNDSTVLSIGPATGAAGTVTLTGTGIVTLSDNGGNAIIGAQAGDTLVNSTNLIEGSGQFGNGTLTLVNSASGTILANGTNALVINTGAAAVSNSGLMEATGTGGLAISSVVNNGTTGHITAAGGNINLQGGDIQGGTLSSSGGAAVQVTYNSSATVDGTAHAVTNTGLLALNDRSLLSLVGALVNTGTLALQSINDTTSLVVGPATGTKGTVTLSGKGTLILSDNASNYIYGAQAGDTLVNSTNLIKGSGQLGNGTLTLINHATINATGSAAALVVNTGSTVTNTALMEATGPAGLVLQATVDDSTTGTLLGAGANVYLQGADIIGGLLKTSGAGLINIQYNNSATLDGSGTHTVTNSGQFVVSDRASLTVLGTLTNTGTISLQSSNDTTDFIAGSPTVTLNGGGVISLSDNIDNYIFGATAATVLNNVNNTIQGSGQIGDNQLTLVNSGIINATGTSNTLEINGDTLVTNTSIMEATGTAGLVFQNTTVQNLGGTLSAIGGDVYLQNTTVKGGLLSAGTGVAIDIQYNNADTLDGSASPVTLNGLFNVEDRGTVTALGTLMNNNSIVLNSSNDTTEFVIGSPTLTLTGGGAVTLSNNADNYIFGSVAADTLDNLNNVISGAGQLGDGQLTLINEAPGIIDANQGIALTISTGGPAMINKGLLESTSTGGLAIVNSTVTNTGTISANGGNISLSGGTLAGGLLSTANGGEFLIGYNNSATLDGSASGITLNGTFAVTDRASLTVLGTVTNLGTISLGSSNDTTELLVGPASGTPGTVTLTGGGTITMTDNSDNYIVGSQAGDTLVNLNNLIVGSGQIGNGQLTFINDSIVDANGGNAIVLNTGTSTVINNDLLEATNTGGLIIQTAVDSSGGGTILAAGGNVYLDGGDVIGGTLNSNGSGAFTTRNSLTGTLDGSAHTVTNLGSIVLNDRSTLSVLGSLVNKGIISLGSTNDFTDFIAGSSKVVLSGAGTVTLSDNSNNRIYGATGADILDNVNNVIEGAGQIGAGQLTLVNAGTIIANGGNALVLNTGSAATTNTGLMEATNTGGLVINDLVNNSGGTILAAGGNVYLDSGTIAGGTLNSSGGGSFVTRNSLIGTLDGSAHSVTSLGSMTVTDRSTLSVLGSLVNKGVIALQSSNNFTDFIVSNAKVTLSGGGTVTLSDNENNRIYGAAVADVLTNVDNTIEGAGQFGAGQLTLVNGGTIAATGGSVLHLNLGSTGLNTANGSLLGIGSGGLSIENGTYTNNGTIQADDGSKVIFQTGASLVNDNAGTLHGGTYAAVASGDGATLSVTGAAVKVGQADLIMSGVGASVIFGGADIQQSLKTIAAGGELQVLNNASFTTTLGLSNLGTIALGGGTLTAGTVVNGAGALLTGNGTILRGLKSSGTLTATGGTLDLRGGQNTISGVTSGSGTLSFDHGTTQLEAGATLGVQNIAMITVATLNVGTAVSFAGTFTMVGNETVTGTGLFTNSGLFQHTGQGVGLVSDPFSNSGTVSVVGGGTLSFTGGLANTGLILTTGVFDDSAALTGGSLTIAGTAAATANIATAAGAGNSTLSTLTVGAGTLNTNGSTITVNGDYNNLSAGAGNTYNPFARVSGTIDGQGTHLTVVGVGGTSISSIVNGTATIAIAAGGKAQFVVENTGPTGSAILRGALETSINGGNITSNALSGSGVTAKNLTPLAAGASSSTYVINYSGGALNGQAIHFASDFANVAGLTIDIVAAPAGSSVPAIAADSTLNRISGVEMMQLHHHSL